MSLGVGHRKLPPLPVLALVEEHRRFSRQRVKPCVVALSCFGPVSGPAAQQIRSAAKGLIAMAPVRVVVPTAPKGIALPMAG